MKKIIAMLLALSFLICLPSCLGRTDYFEHSFFALNTEVEIRLIAGEYDPKPIFDECERLITSAGQKLSVHIETSDVAMINSEKDAVTDLSESTLELIDLANKYSTLTDGAFDITVGALEELAELCDERNSPATEDELAAARETVGYRGLSVKNDVVFKSDAKVKVTFAGIANGYLTEKLLEYLASTEASGGVVSIGGNAGVFGEKKYGAEYEIALRSPFDGEDILGELLIADGCISTARNDKVRYNVQGEKHGHLIDPESGELVSNDILTLSVICRSGAMADALSTALYVMGYDDAVNFHQSSGASFEMIIVREDGITVTEGLRELFEAESDMKVTYCK